MKVCIKYLALAAIGLLAVGLPMAAGGSTGSFADVMRAASDNFFSVGVFLAGIGLLNYAGNCGAFRLLAYGLHVFAESVASLLFWRREAGRSQSFSQFNRRKSAEKRGVAAALTVGLVFVALSFVFLAAYYGAET